ncbi:MAG: hypothetical protein ACT4P4_16070 [Betaproteobacteria bacterium]
MNAGEVLLLEHTYEPGIYGLPGGGLDNGEDPLHLPPSSRAATA